MNKILLVIRHEYLTRVRKKSFLLMTILGPLLMGGIFVAAFMLDRVDTEVKTIAVIDDSHLFDGKFKDSDRLHFIYSKDPVDSLRGRSKAQGLFGVLYIPATPNISLLEKAITFYSESQPGLDVISKIKFTIEKEINTQKYVEAGMVMRGVMEEKTSRIVEVIISSVKPFQLMMGKNVGVALVGLTQFLLWVVLSSIVYTGVTSVMLNGKSEKEKIETMMKVQPGMQSNQALQQQFMQENGEAGTKVTDMLSSINFPLLIAMFIFYFLAGYLLYSALFAAIGAAVDSETDTQQFMLPVTIPLIIAYVAAINVINNPQGNVEVAEVS